MPKTRHHPVFCFYGDIIFSSRFFPPDVVFDPFHFGLSTYVRCHLYPGGFGCDKRQGQIQSMPLLRFGRVGLQCQWWESPWQRRRIRHGWWKLLRVGMVRTFAWTNNRRKVVVSWLQGSPPSLVSRTRLQRRDSGEFWVCTACCMPGVLACGSGVAACARVRGSLARLKGNACQSWVFF